ncbi:Gp49 family protein [uncultured Thiodictyon sp.]|uniref:Gp49 family protein n=1 Tax=uncultured Thiodictyon sp. TaxID=1846217 RepID=UPI0025D499E7|nr:Gp49 family protein [uncultured Thiodictyon sp.]
MTDQDIENEIRAINSHVAPRVTLADIEEEITSEWTFTAAQGVDQAYQGNVQPECVPGVLCRLTFCVLVLRNGFTLVGKSSCVSAENFNADLGRKLARENAINHAWPLFGFALAERLYQIVPE